MTGALESRMCPARVAIPACLLIVGLLQLPLPDVPDLAVLAAGLPIICLCAPLLFRFSRIIWMHLDRTIDPGEK